MFLRDFFNIYLIKDMKIKNNVNSKKGYTHENI